MQHRRQSDCNMRVRAGRTRWSALDVQCLYRKEKNQVTITDSTPATLVALLAAPPHRQQPARTPVVRSGRRAELKQGPIRTSCTRIMEQVPCPDQGGGCGSADPAINRLPAATEGCSTDAMRAAFMSTPTEIRFNSEDITLREHAEPGDPGACRRR